MTENLSLHAAFCEIAATVQTDNSASSVKWTNLLAQVDDCLLALTHIPNFKFTTTKDKAGNRFEGTIGQLHLSSEQIEGINQVQQSMKRFMSNPNIGDLASSLQAGLSLFPNNPADIALGIKNNLALVAKRVEEILSPEGRAALKRQRPSPEGLHA